MSAAVLSSARGRRVKGALLAQLLWKANVAMILMMLLIYLVDGISDRMKLHLIIPVLFIAKSIGEALLILAVSLIHC